MKLLRQGSRGPQVVRWQEFLIGQALYNGAADGIFGPLTARATRAFQRRVNEARWALGEPPIAVDGIAGNATLGSAMALGFKLVRGGTGKNSAAWPPKPKFKWLSYAERSRVFGHISFKPSPTRSNRELIVIINNWVSDNLVSRVVPQLKGIRGAPKSGRVFVHKLVADPLCELMQTLEDKYLLEQVRSYDGLWCARLVRGGTHLSSHSFAAALDLNYLWNRLGTRGALVGEVGSMREIAAVANKQGWWWGGHGWGPGSRTDPMHIEYVGGGKL